MQGVRAWQSARENGICGLQPRRLIPVSKPRSGARIHERPLGSAQTTSSTRFRRRLYVDDGGPEGGVNSNVSLVRHSRGAWARASVGASTLLPLAPQRRANSFRQTSAIKANGRAACLGYMELPLNPNYGSGDTPKPAFCGTI
jgi:hypothetical protein